MVALIIGCSIIKTSETGTGTITWVIKRKQINDILNTWQLGNATLMSLSNAKSWQAKSLPNL